MFDRGEDANKSKYQCLMASSKEAKEAVDTTTK